ncbi:hypothetical protein BN1708_019867, partial [Verticillium longisporum]
CPPPHRRDQLPRLQADQRHGSFGRYRGPQRPQRCRGLREL